MNTTHSTTKAMLLQDYLVSKKKDLGEFALDMMKIYDDFSYELVIVDAKNDRGQKVTGSAIAPTKQAIKEIVRLNKLTGDFYIREIDCQKEFFCLLAEIRDDLSLNPGKR